MASRIEDYGLIGDCRTAALVSKTGSIDWLCLPRFDSGACFAALLGTRENGLWEVSPSGKVTSTVRRYQGNTLILETDYETEEGAVTVVDFMPLRKEAPDIVRIVVGKRGSVRMSTELTIRFDYGSIVPWVRHTHSGLVANGGPDALRLSTPVLIKGQNFHSYGHFIVNEGERVPFVLTWYPSYRSVPAEVDAEKALVETRRFWERWSQNFVAPAEFGPEILRSLITLKALTDERTGGIVAAATTSLPERIGGVRNWDYRYCWLRDATFTLYALMNGGFVEEAKAWREWLLRAVAGKPSELQIMYGVVGNRRLTELELPWLSGYEDSRPVRIGNAAYGQLQLDVYGEIIDALHECYRVGLPPNQAAWNLQRTLLHYLEDAWEKADEGIWEVRGGQKHFTHSKVMAWVAIDRGINSAELMKLEAPLDRWKALRLKIHTEVLERGYDRIGGTFVQHYGSKALDASLLMIPLVGFLPVTDERVMRTIDAVQKHLLHHGLLKRYLNAEVDGLPPGEGVFLACSFWLADCLCLLGRHREARALFKQLLDLRNDVGLLSEEYDPVTKRMLGNFPQAFSHVSLVNTAFMLSKGTTSSTADRR